MPWKITKKEYEIVHGLSRLKNVVEEMENEKNSEFSKKEIIDYVIKGFGILALLSPFIILFIQTQKEQQKQKALFALNIATEAMTQLYEMKDLVDSEQDITKQMKVFSTITKAKINLLNEPDISRHIDSIDVFYTNVYQQLFEVINARKKLDSILTEISENGTYKKREIDQYDSSLNDFALTSTAFLIPVSNIISANTGRWYYFYDTSKFHIDSTSKSLDSLSIAISNFYPCLLKAYNYYNKFKHLSIDSLSKRDEKDSNTWMDIESAFYTNKWTINEMFNKRVSDFLNSFIQSNILLNQ